MISFYPGPSRVYSQVPKFVKEAYDQGILSINHRSDEFVKLYQQTKTLLREKLAIPDPYSIYFTSSATECWEIIAQSLIEQSYHIYTGAFGEKWFQYTKKLNPYAIGYQCDHNQPIVAEGFDFASGDGVICLTQNETSNGTCVDNEIIGAFREKHPENVIAVDATSSMAGVNLKFENADVWYASVQKCFGLPAGMAILICSPRAIDRAKSINERQHYNSLLNITENEVLNQTTHTPNVLGVYLMMRVMEQVQSIDVVDKLISKRAKALYKTCAQLNNYDPLIENPAVRSKTVITVKGEEKTIQAIKSKAKKEGIILGNGYGALKNDTFRIANFPAIKESEVKTLRKFLKSLE
ncbi:MAG: aminotransferase class V-fold PLP-dependent enzyme [Bacteroidota bacterium]